MGLLRPSAVEHTTGVVFRVGTPGRLAGRCLWPSLSSRKSKATGVVAVPFSSISPLYHLLRFLPSFHSPSFPLFPLSFSFSPPVSISCLVSTSFAFSSYHHVFAPVGLTSLNFCSPVCASSSIHVPAGHERVSCSRICNGARVKTIKNK